MIATDKCIKCILDKKKKALENIKTESRRNEYFEILNNEIEKMKEKRSAPYMLAKADELYESYFGKDYSYADVKKRYNDYMLSKEDDLRQNILQNDDVIEAGVKYACAGNYIDFGAMSTVDDGILNKILTRAENEILNAETFLKFKEDLKKAKKLVYLTDNCGEIVIDKLFIENIKKCYSEIEITVVVRGKDTLNDATLVDAKAVGIDKVANTVGNGTNIPGTSIEDILPEVRKIIKSADVIISKGQGNFETMYGTGFNTYYLFLCKCALFLDMFGLEQYATVFMNEKDIKIKR